MKELEKKVEDRDKMMEEMKKILDDIVSQFEGSKVKVEEENTKLKQKVKELEGTIDEMKETNIGREDQKAAADAKNWTKVIKTVRSPKTGAYTFKEAIIHKEKIKDFLAN